VEAPPAPAAIDVDRARGVTISWEDGHVTFLAAEELRRRCPCAGCRVERDRGSTPPTAAGPVTIVDASLAGAWGLSPVWSDGHSAGIYTWVMLRYWCRCDECAT
jgi:DUF971 family protein